MLWMKQISCMFMYVISHIHINTRTQRWLNEESCYFLLTNCNELNLFGYLRSDDPVLFVAVYLSSSIKLFLLILIHHLLSIYCLLCFVAVSAHAPHTNRTKNYFVFSKCLATGLVLINEFVFLFVSFFFAVFSLFLFCFCSSGCWYFFMPSK